jgi:hypothetical protein
MYDGSRGLCELDARSDPLILLQGFITNKMPACCHQQYGIYGYQKFIGMYVQLLVQIL